MRMTGAGCALSAWCISSSLYRPLVSFGNALRSARLSATLPNMTCGIFCHMKPFGPSPG
jgi:hypothetical protein